MGVVRVAVGTQERAEHARGTFLSCRPFALRMFHITSKHTNIRASCERPVKVGGLIKLLDQTDANTSLSNVNLLTPRCSTGFVHIYYLLI